jgi:hydroxymethylglutaryl-CoA lyase
MNASSHLPSSVIIEEQGLRDGFQSEKQIIPAEKKLHFLERLMGAGLKRFQVCSFVNPKLVPQMADAEELCAALPKRNDVTFSGLVLNMKGLERAAKAGLKHVGISISASDTHSRKNTNKSLDEAQQEFLTMVTEAKRLGLVVRGGIQSAFGCRYEGAISEELVIRLAQQHLDAGVDELAIADSTGMGNPLAVRRVMTDIVRRAGERLVLVHLHDTENKGLANVYAALESGVRGFDTAFGGLGGCPFIKGATGNIATEDTVHLLHQMGIATGIDIAKVAAASIELQEYLAKSLPSKMYSLLQRTDVQVI